MTTPSELISNLRGLLGKVTPGPWHFNPDNVGATAHHGYGLLSGDGEIGYGSKSLPIHIEASRTREKEFGKGTCEAIAEYVALLSPDNITLLLDGYSEMADAVGWLRAALTAKEDEIRALREAVEFAHAHGFEWPSDPFPQQDKAP